MSINQSKMEQLSFLLNALADFAYCVHLQADGASEQEWISTQPFLEKLGYDEAQLADFLSIVDENDRDFVQAHLEDRSKDPNTFDCRIYSSEGHLRWLRLQRHPIYDANSDTVTQVYYVGQDISEAYAQYIYQRDLLGRVPHELAQPISTILTRLYMLRKQPNRLDYHLNIVDEIVNRLKMLLHDLQTLSRLERGIKANDHMNFSLAMLMQQVLSSQKESASKKQISLNASLSPTPIQLHASHEQLKHALSGIISYILHFSPNDSTITIRCYQQEQTLLIDVYAPPQSLENNMLETLFLPFARLRNNSTEFSGLELALAQAILESQGGDITVQMNASDDQYGEHHLFQVTFPITTA